MSSIFVLLEYESVTKKAVVSVRLCQNKKCKSISSHCWLIFWGCTFKNHFMHCTITYCHWYLYSVRKMRMNFQEKSSHHELL